MMPTRTIARGVRAQLHTARHGLRRFLTTMGLGVSQRPRGTLVTLVILAVVLTTAAVALWRSGERHEAIDAVGARVPNIAEQHVVALFSYDYRSIDSKVRRASPRLTGTFQRGYVARLQDTVIPRAKRDKAIARTRVVASAIEPMNTLTKAQVIVFFDQTFRTETSAEPTVIGGRLRATLILKNNRWLVSNAVPI